MPQQRQSQYVAVFMKPSTKSPAILARLAPRPVTPEHPLAASVFELGGATPLDADLHTCFEVGIVLAGRHERHCEDFVLRLEPGDVWLDPGWDPYVWRILEPQTLLVMHFLPEALGDEHILGQPWLSLFAVDPASRPRVRSEHRRLEILALGYGMKREIERQEAGWLEAARLDMLRVLLVLCRDWDRPTGEEQSARTRIGDLETIMPAIRLVSAVPIERVSREEAATACSLSIRQFSHIFRRVMGVSFGRFALRARLATAARYLLSTDLSVEAVAAQMGFVDGGHLRRIFREHYGQTPARYREAGRMITDAARPGQISPATGAKGNTASS